MNEEALAHWGGGSVASQTDRQTIKFIQGNWRPLKDDLEDVHICIFTLTVDSYQVHLALFKDQFVLRLSALTPIANLHHFLICALSFSA